MLLRLMEGLIIQHINKYGGTKRALTQHIITQQCSIMLLPGILLCIVYNN